MEELTKPVLRGYFHLVAFFGAVVATVVLVSKSHGLPEIYSSTIYGFSLILLFGISALYHRPHWGKKVYSIMRRLDHSAIFIFIAGTTTPLCLLALPDSVGSKLLITVWIAAFLGVLQALFWTQGPKWVRALLYVGAGWILGPYFSDFKAALGDGSENLILAGGLMYTLGAVVYALRKPNPFPRVFGYHEVFHIMVIVAASLHYAVIYRLVEH